ncbi:MAG: hypothetical protein ACE5H1_02455 [Thermodesulfobacteriota bacterium]
MGNGENSKLWIGGVGLVVGLLLMFFLKPVDVVMPELPEDKFVHNIDASRISVNLAAEDLEGLTTLTDTIDKKIPDAVDYVEVTRGEVVTQYTPAKIIAILESKSNRNRGSGNLEDVREDGIDEIEDEFDRVDTCDNREYDDDDIKWREFDSLSVVQEERDDEDEYVLTFHDVELEYDNRCTRIFDKIIVEYDGNDVDVDFKD